MRWDETKAAAVVNFVPPMKPSNSELCVYTRYLRQIQRSQNNRVSVLVLGSTVEFRDWGFEHFLNVTVVDYSDAYYSASTTFARHKNPSERFVHCKWQDMTFESEFDIILGDAIIGNLLREEIDGVMRNIHCALTRKGIFMTKNNLKNKTKLKPFEEYVRHYYQNKRHLHPIAVLFLPALISCMDQEREVVTAASVFKEVDRLYKAGIVKDDIFGAFEAIGSHDFEHYLPTLERWEETIKRHFKRYAKEHSEDVYHEDYPLYVISKS